MIKSKQDFLVSSKRYLPRVVTGQGEGRIGVVRVDPEWFAERRQHERIDTGLGQRSVFGCRGVALEDDPDRTDSVARPELSANLALM